MLDYDICMMMESKGITSIRQEENDDTGRNLRSVSVS